MVLGNKVGVMVAALIFSTVAAVPAEAFELPSLADFAAPTPSDPTTGADLSDVTGKIQLTTITGITSLTVLSFPDVELFLKPLTATDQLEITQVPRTGDVDRPNQVTTINDTTSLKVISTPYFFYFDGAEPNPPQLQPSSDQADLSFILENSAPDVSVPSVVALQGLRPTSITGPATMTTQTLTLLGTSTKFSDLFLTIVDPDNIVQVLPTPTTRVGTITDATTAGGIEALLDPFTLSALDLNSVLNGLVLSTDKVGAVNLPALTSRLSADGFTVRKIENLSLPTAVEFIPKYKRLDFTNPGGINRRIVLLGTDELPEADESRIHALKNVDSPQNTHVIQSYKDKVGNQCLCVVEYDFDPELGGITDLAGAVQGADKRMNNSVTTFAIRPTPSLLPNWNEERVEEFKTEGASVKRVHAPSVDAVSEDHINALFLNEAVPATPSHQVPAIWEDHLMILEPRFGRLAPSKSELNEALGSHKGVLGDFTMSWCKECLTPEQVEELQDTMGEHEVFPPRGVVALPELFPPDMSSVILGPSDQVFQLLDQDDLNTQVASTYSTVRFRVVQDNTRFAVGGADVVLQSFLPGWKGNTVQKFTVVTNTLGYASVKLLPNVGYNFTISKEGFVDYVGSGASPSPGQTEGQDVRVKPTKGWRALSEPVATWGGLAVFAISLAVLVMWRTGQFKKIGAGLKARRARRGGRRGGN